MRLSEVDKEAADESEETSRSPQLFEHPPLPEAITPPTAPIAAGVMIPRNERSLEAYTISSLPGRSTIVIVLAGEKRGVAATVVTFRLGFSVKWTELQPDSNMTAPMTRTYFKMPSPL